MAILPSPHLHSYAKSAWNWFNDFTQGRHSHLHHAQDWTPLNVFNGTEVRDRLHNFGDLLKDHAPNILALSRATQFPSTSHLRLLPRIVTQSSLYNRDHLKSYDGMGKLLRGSRKTPWARSAYRNVGLRRTDYTRWTHKNMGQRTWHNSYKRQRFLRKNDWRTTAKNKRSPRTRYRNARKRWQAE